MKEKRGISLITLVITVIVIIILVAAIVLTLNNSGILTNASLAKYEQDRDTMQAVLDMAVQKAVLRHQGSINLNTGKIKDDKVVWSSEDLKGLVGKIVFDDGTDGDNEFYTGEKLPVYGSETTWYVDDNGKLVLKVGERIIGADEVPIGIGDYVDYGVDVNENGITTDDWMLFYDDGKHKYIIATDYIPIKWIPNGKKGTKITEYSTYKLSFNEIYKDYIGASDIKEHGKSYLSFLNTYSNSANGNIRAVAYMLDTDVWNETIFYTDKAEYVIGGPTLDMFVASYNKIHPDKAIEYAIYNISGYRVKWNNDKEYLDYMYGLDENLPWIITNVSKANGMWLASPSASSGSSNLMYVNFNGGINNVYMLSNSIYGLRPVVCIKSEVKLQ